MGRPWSRATPAKMWRGRSYIANARLAPQSHPCGDSSKGPLNRPKDTGFGQPRHARCTAAGRKLLGFLLTRSRQIRRESNDNKCLRLQTLAPSLIESYSVLETVTNRCALRAASTAASVAALLSDKSRDQNQAVLDHLNLLADQARGGGDRPN